MRLPEAFVTRMNKYFSAHTEFDPAAFYASFDDDNPRGIRINRAKVHEGEDFPILTDVFGDCKPISWCRDGYYIQSDPSGRDPYYHAGVYYIQEPSAMLPAEVLGAKPGEKILDLCAAPGGKATRIGTDMQGDGLLVANEISADRARALLRNLELFGIENVVITNESPNRLQERFPLYFDRILIDAPCSGEGMFRRDKNAMRSWEKYGPKVCEVMQKEILLAAHHMLREGGHLVYSTCTFGTSENEDMIDDFLQNHPEYQVVTHAFGESITPCSGKLFSGGMRIWPQIGAGDGHFCVHLVKSESQGEIANALPTGKIRRQNPLSMFSVRSALDAYLGFLKELYIEDAYLDAQNIAQRQFVLQSDKIHLLPVPVDTFHGLKVVKMGAFPGEINETPKGRIFIPSHALALSLSKNMVRKDRILTLSRKDDRLLRYLRGETIQISAEEKYSLAASGYVLICVNQFPLGFGKVSDNMIKNQYPKAWRLQ